MQEIRIERGSTWYAWGHHWKVVATGQTRDGEDAVALVCTSDRKKPHARATVVTSKLLRHGEETSDS